ncbi:hypothetical protein G7B40_021090 [Aetokthonos hydrillicola Thurmond2011]|jgi:hypothetical protein|uniref:Uncharacterized protein n=1 Tax=Aetokthonos hydrillicola Thurmond2011 TaxID=2712845 RepID=A0AAP5I9B9_9CYAN|nr:hypothetical protein [Aetokthonos hydrillicola]MBO3458651.1 hypothetical protein [Aetokthonos hydrillicola CCALA 1050]MBW4588004.1 hypothetical protein [Aetokthonos hydrillicola CCALA 1050]MDR9897044.1 hypothetical protein [Aetokthonos hydrillicola Thurmond2011]
MSDEIDELITREEVLSGFPARRASTLLFLIESQTAQLAARSQMTFSLTHKTSQEQDLAFFKAFAVEQQLLHPTIQQLERYAPQWASLVPENPRIKAALAHALSQKYSFPYHVLRNIRAALGLDTQTVRVAYSRLYKTRIETIFVSSLPFIEKLRWTLAAIAQRLESQSPFWIALLLTIALGLPQAILALPIAVAYIGPMVTIALLIVIGGTNIFTMACMAEAVSRSGDFRYGNASIKEFVSNYLGRTGSLIFSIAIGIRVFFIALACYIGLSVTMANFTHLPSTVWGVLLFITGLYLVLYKSLRFTVAMMLVLATINVGLILTLSILAFQHIQLNNLLYINLPFFGGNSFTPQMIQQAFGVSCMLYFGHTYVGECAKFTLPRDPSATSLIWGTITGTIFLTVLFCVWVLAVNGSVPPSLLAEQIGTSLDVLAIEIGPIVGILGTVLVTLLLGMAWIRSSSLLLSLVQEWLPIRSHPILLLPPHQGTLILRPRRNLIQVPCLGLTYLGIQENQPQFRLDIQSQGKIHRVQIATDDFWDIQALFPQFPELQKQHVCLTLKVQSVELEGIWVQVKSSMNMTYEGTLTSNSHKVVPKTTSQTSSVQKWAIAPNAVLRTISQWLWSNLQNKSYFLLSISPLVLVFLLAELFFFAGVQSFTSVLAFAGVLGNCLVGGIFPILLLITSRRKGDLIPGVVLRILNQPLLQVTIYSLFIVILVVHSLFIWQHPIARASALSIAFICLATTIMMKLQGIFASRVTVELREEQQPGKTSICTITGGGRHKSAQVLLGYPEGEQQHQAATVEIPSISSLQYAIFQLPTEREAELRVWVHRTKSFGDSRTFPAILEIENGIEKMQFDLKLLRGQILIPLQEDRCWLKVTFPPPYPISA